MADGLREERNAFQAMAEALETDLLQTREALKQSVEEKAQADKQQVRREKCRAHPESVDC